jgi:hypothetical protein
MLRSQEVPDGRLANFTAYGAAGALAAVAAYFSVSGMTEMFPGAPGAIIALAGTMEATKLVTGGGWLARQPVGCCAWF